MKRVYPKGLFRTPIPLWQIVGGRMDSQERVLALFGFFGIRFPNTQKEVFQMHKKLVSPQDFRPPGDQNQL